MGAIQVRRTTWTDTLACISIAIGLAGLGAKPIRAAAELAAPTTVPAGEARTDEQQFNAVAAARTRTELALRDLRKLLQANHAAGGDVETPALPRPTALIQSQKALDAEQQKPAAEQVKARIDELGARTAALSQVLRKYADSSKAVTSALNDGAAQYAAIAAAMRQVVVLEGYWKQLRMELSSVEESYAALAERAESTARRCRTALDAQRTAQSEWEAASKKQSADSPAGK